MPKLKNSNETFWVIFKQCEYETILVIFTHCESATITQKVEKVWVEEDGVKAKGNLWKICVDSDFQL